MADLRIDETFDLPAPPGRVWELLVAPERIVGCLPGAALEEKVDERTYRGTMTVRLGAVTVVYKGQVVFEETDPAARTLRMKGEGRESTGSGSARMTMTSRVEPLEGGGSRTTVGADVTISGKMVRFGRGMIERVAREVFREFTDGLAEMAREGDAERATERDAAGGAGGEGVEVAEVGGAGAEVAEAGGDSAEGAEGAEVAGVAGAEVAEETIRDHAEDAEDAEDAEGAEDAPGGGGRETTLRLGPILVTVFVGWLGDLVDRIRGKGK